MIVRKQLFLIALLLVARAVVFPEATKCPAGSAAIRFHSLAGSQIAIPVWINHSGPYEFMVDTGSEITVMDPKLAAELKLQAQGSIRMAFATSYTSADLVQPEIVETGPAAVRKLVVAVKGLNQLQTSNPRLRGILGENFLGRFDLLIDYHHKVICLDQSKELQNQIKGERVPTIEPLEQEGGPAGMLSIMVTVHLPGDGKKGTILRIDSGSSAPILFTHQVEALSWQQRCHARQGTIAGNGDGPVFAVMSSRDVRIGLHTIRQMVFLTPINTGRSMPRADADGLLPTALFLKVFISSAGHFVIFDPQARR